ncbi:AfsR/SARP family transcriptional regulator [Actinoplanes sp. CA-030573]|uniref:AfsR/SARP family transcriptional regulator n=1 Tax=Actinoplanes sp. CA-030573 TaxID=3239898 RepID=UPI003D8AB386
MITGPPVLAAACWAHFQWRRPSGADIRAWMQPPLTAEMILAGCGIVAVLGWLFVVYLLMIRARQRVRAWWHRVRRLPLPTPAQVTAGSLAGMAALTLPGITAEATAAPAAPQAADLEQADDPACSPTGIDLPGGTWIPPSAALAVAATTSLIWLHRRRHYHPAPPQPRPGRDQDLPTLPATVQAILARTAPGQHTEPAALLNPLPAGVVTLSGPGAESAARGLIAVAALSAVTAGHRRLHLRPADAARILPGADPDTAIAGARIDDQPPAVGETSLSLQPGTHATITWHVAIDGLTTGTGISAPRRLCVLDLQAALDLITLAGLAHHMGPNMPADQSDTPSAPPVESPGASGQLRLIGGCDLAIAGTPIRLHRRAGLQILAYLGVHDRGATRTDLITACWPGIPPATITQRLHTTLADLRKQLRPLLGADPVLHPDDHYHLNTDVIGTDLQPWRRAVHAARHASTATDRREACRTVIRLYAGDIAERHQWPWVLTWREVARRDALDAYIALIDAAEPRQRAALLQRALAVDPDNEDLRRRASRRE